MDELMNAVRELLQDRTLNVFLMAAHTPRLQEALRLAELERALGPGSRPTASLYIAYWRDGVGIEARDTTTMHTSEDKAIEVARNAIDSGIKSALVAAVTHRVIPVRSVNVEAL